MALSTQGFALRALPEAPAFPTNLGVVAPINYARINDMALQAHQANLADRAANLAQQNAGLAQQEGQVRLDNERQQGALAAVRAPLENANLQAETASRQGALARVQKTDADQAALEQEWQQQAPDFQAELDTIKNEPDPLLRAHAYEGLPAKYRGLALPTNKALVGMLHNQALADQAAAKQAADAAKVAQQQAGATDRAQLTADQRATAAADATAARLAGVGGAPNVAADREVEAQQAYDAALASGDIAAANEAEKLLLIRKEASKRSGRSFTVNKVAPNGGSLFGGGAAAAFGAPAPVPAAQPAIVVSGSVPVGTDIHALNQPNPVQTFNSASLTGEDKDAFEWAMAHTTDPRSAQIIAKLRGH